MPTTATIIEMPARCDCCGLRWNTLFDTFVNGLGWQRYCGGCADPRDDGPPRPYLGRYPIPAAAHLRIVAGSAL